MLKWVFSAMTVVQRGSMPQCEAARRYSIPRKTLVNYLKLGRVEKQTGVVQFLHLSKKMIWHQELKHLPQ